MMVKAVDLINSLISRVKELFNLKNFTQLISDVLGKEYDKGLNEVELDLDMNLTPSSDKKEDIILTGVETIGDFDSQMTDKLKTELMRGIASGDTNTMIKKRIIGFFGKKPNQSKFNWNDRLNTILRTERNRAVNAGKFFAAKDSGLQGLRKYLDVIVDDRTSNICLAEHRKYGDEDKSIPMDKPFTVRAGNKTYTAMFPPFHPNCRTEMRIDSSKVKR